MRNCMKNRAGRLLVALLALGFGITFGMAAMGQPRSKSDGASDDARGKGSGQPAAKKKDGEKAPVPGKPTPDKKEPPPKEPKVPVVDVPKTEPKPSEGDTAGAIRGRPATGADGKPGATSDDPWQLLMDLNRRFAALERRMQSMEAELAARSGAGADPGAAAAADATPPGEDDAGTPSTKGPSTETAEADPSDAAGGAVTLVANPELKGRLGRIVVEAPEGTKNRSPISFYNAGEEEGSAADSGYGTLTSETLAGAYTVVMHKVKLPIEVRRGHDTVVKLGVLRINASKQTAWSLLLTDGETGASGYGSEEVGVLPGDYVVKIKKSSEPVTVEPGKVLEF